MKGNEILGLMFLVFLLFLTIKFEYSFSISMHFIKNKLGQLKKTIFSVNNNKIVNSPKELLEHLLSSSNDSPDIDIYKELSELSRTS